MVCNPLDNVVLQGRYDGYPRRRGLTRVDELWAAGAQVGIGHDSVQDPWYRLGTGEPVDAAYMLVHVGHLTGEDEMARVFRTLVDDNHRPFGGAPVLAEGYRGGMVWWPSADPVDLIRSGRGRWCCDPRGEEPGVPRGMRPFLLPFLAAILSVLPLVRDVADLVRVARLNGLGRYDEAEIVMQGQQQRWERATGSRNILAGLLYWHHGYRRLDADPRGALESLARARFDPEGLRARRARPRRHDGHDRFGPGPAEALRRGRAVDVRRAAYSGEAQLGPEKSARRLHRKTARGDLHRHRSRKGGADVRAVARRSCPQRGWALRAGRPADEPRDRPAEERRCRGGRRVAGGGAPAQGADVRPRARLGPHGARKPPARAVRGGSGCYRHPASDPEWYQRRGEPVPRVWLAGETCASVRAR